MVPRQAGGKRWWYVWCACLCIGMEAMGSAVILITSKAKEDGFQLDVIISPL